MPAASVDYVALSETLTRRGGCLALRAGRRHSLGKGIDYQDLTELVAEIPRTGSLAEKILCGDLNGAAARLLRRV